MNRRNGWLPAGALIFAASQALSAASFFVAPVSTCSTFAHSLVVSDTASPFGLSVTGNVTVTAPAASSPSVPGVCGVHWVAQRPTTGIVAGNYQLVEPLDVDYSIPANVSVFFSGGSYVTFFDESLVIPESLVGPFASPASGNHIFVGTGPAFAFDGSPRQLSQDFLISFNNYTTSPQSVTLDFPWQTYIIEANSSAPEPGTVILAVGGLCLMALWRYRRASGIAR